MKKTKSDNTKRGWNDMPVAEQARWLCLLQAVDASASFAEKNNIDPNKSYKWIKPSAFNAYIAETFPSMEVRLQQEADGVIFND
jgi:hypothetical protein